MSPPPFLYHVKTSISRVKKSSLCHKEIRQILSDIRPRQRLERLGCSLCVLSPILKEILKLGDWIFCCCFRAKKNQVLARVLSLLRTKQAAATTAECNYGKNTNVFFFKLYCLFNRTIFLCLPIWKEELCFGLSIRLMSLVHMISHEPPDRISSNLARTSSWTQG